MRKEHPNFVFYHAFILMLAILMVSSHSTLADGEQGSPAPNDGYEPMPSIIERILDLIIPPAEAYTGEECQERFVKNNCTWFVAGLRPDVCEWIGSSPRHAYLWSERARQNGQNFGIQVDQHPDRGDIVVWSAGCGGTTPIPPTGPCTNYENEWKGCGHVAFVSDVTEDSKKIQIQELNWNPNRSGNYIKVLDCMQFISLPKQDSPPPQNDMGKQIEDLEKKIQENIEHWWENFFEKQEQKFEQWLQQLLQKMMEWLLHALEEWIENNCASMIIPGGIALIIVHNRNRIRKASNQK
ncbi:MAG: CHAP domain-containing protein [Candidatus Hadarchaeum sp.]